MSAPIASPDGRTAAVGLNFGELVIVDMQRLRLTLRMELASPSANVNVITWPRPDLLVTLVCDEAGKYGCLNDRLVLVDPLERRAVARVGLDGDAVHWLAAAKDLAAVLVSPEDSFGPVRVVTVDGRAFVHTYVLDRLSAGEHGGALGPSYLHPEFALFKTTAAILVPHRPVALIKLRTGRVRYRSSPELWRGWSDWQHAEAWTGTIEPRADVWTLVQPTWPGIVAIGATQRGLLRHGNGIDSRSRGLGARLYDIRRGTVRVLSPRAWVEAFAGNHALATGRQLGSRPGRPLVRAYNERGRVAFSIPAETRDLGTWFAFGERIYTGLPSGRARRVYDARNGRFLRFVRPTDVRPAFAWPSG
jgi:hypothetical protein